MKTAIATNAAVSTPRIWNCRTTGSLPISGRRDGAGPLLLALRTGSLTPIVVSGSKPTGDVMPMRTCVVGTSKSAFSARGSPPKSFVILSAIADPPTLAAPPLRCPPSGRNPCLGTALRLESVPPTLGASPLRCPPRGRSSCLGMARRHECVLPRRSYADLQESGIAGEQAEIDLPPGHAFRIAPARHLPRRHAVVDRLGGELREVARAQHALDDDADALAAARRQQDQPREAAACNLAVAEEGGKIDDAVEVAANVREPEEPRLRERDGHDRRHGDHLAGVAQADQPAPRAAGDAEARRLDLRGRLARETTRELLLE